MAKTNWREALESAKASGGKRDCGHIKKPLTINGETKLSDLWFFNVDSRLGEAWTVCADCGMRNLKEDRQPLYQFTEGTDRAPWTKHFLD